MEDGSVSSGRPCPSPAGIRRSAVAMQTPEQVNRLGPRPLAILLPRCHLVVISSMSITGKVRWKGLGVGLDESVEGEAVELALREDEF